jgi:hypothetical protein
VWNFRLIWGKCLVLKVRAVCVGRNSEVNIFENISKMGWQVFFGNFEKILVVFFALNVSV